MKRLKEKTHQIIKNSKIIMASLMVVAFLLTTTTFSYWALNVEGQSEQTTFVFQIGEYLSTVFDFVLDEEDVVYSYTVDLDYLFEDYEINEHNVVFGIVWNDPSDADVYESGIDEENIEVTYEFKFYKDGIEASRRDSRKLSRYIELSENNSNPRTITYGGETKEFGFSIYLNSKKSLSSLLTLQDYEVYVEISYNITD